MPSRERIRAIGIQQAGYLRLQLGREARTLRRRAGLSQEELARAIGVSRGWVHRLELGRLRSVDLVRTARLFACLGHRLSAKVYPVGEPLRDAGQARLLARFNARLSPAWHRSFEVVMPIRGDLRAWDEVIAGPVRIGVEAETRPGNLEATQRAMAAKQRDSGVDRTILLLAATHANRTLVRDHIGAVRQSFPLDTRSTMAALSTGHDPGANALVIL